MNIKHTKKKKKKQSKNMRKNTKTASDAQIAIGFAAVCFTFGLLTGLIIAHVIYCGTL